MNEKTHTILGSIQQVKDDIFIANIKYLNQSLEITINLDGSSYDSSIDLASSVTQQLDMLDRKAKLVINDDLLDIYNDEWRSFEQLQTNGVYRSISNPILSSKEFISKFNLQSIQILGDDCIEFCYGESELFHGHSIYVNSFDGIQFTIVNAEIFG